MSLLGIKVLGSGSYVPASILSNKQLESIVETSDDWISSRTGIKNRHIASTENTVDLAYQSAKQAIEHANIDPTEIGMIIVATFTPEHLTPSTACLVQAKLGLNDIHIIAFDVNAACSGFVYGITIAHQFLKTGAIKKALIIGAEVLSKIMDWEDRNTCVLFGDGAGAVVVEYDGTSPESFYLNSAGDERGSLITTPIPLINPLTDIKNEPIHFKMNGPEVFKFAIHAIKDTINQLLEQSNLTIDEINLVIPHQANKRIIDKVVKDLKVPSEQFFLNLAHYGNTSAASIPIALKESITTGRAKSGDKIMLIGFGGGLTWGGCIISL